jgi:hypothetical protein
VDVIIYVETNFLMAVAIGREARGPDRYDFRERAHSNPGRLLYGVVLGF